ncbi:hypothetical protein [Bradyrhizobium sp. USDA 4504]
MIGINFCWSSTALAAMEFGNEPLLAPGLDIAFLIEHCLHFDTNASEVQQ